MLNNEKEQVNSNEKNPIELNAELKIKIYERTNSIINTCRDILKYFESFQTFKPWNLDKLINVKEIEDIEKNVKFENKYWQSYQSMHQLYKEHREKASELDFLTFQENQKSKVILCLTINLSKIVGNKYYIDAILKNLWNYQNEIETIYINNNNLFKYYVSLLKKYAVDENIFIRPEEYKENDLAYNVDFLINQLKNKKFGSEQYELEEEFISENTFKKVITDKQEELLSHIKQNNEFKKNLDERRHLFIKIEEKLTKLSKQYEYIENDEDDEETANEVITGVFIDKKVELLFNYYAAVINLKEEDLKNNKSIKNNDNIRDIYLIKDAFEESEDIANMLLQEVQYISTKYENLKKGNAMNIITRINSLVSKIKKLVEKF